MTGRVPGAPLIAVFDEWERAISITLPVAAFGASLCWDLPSPGIYFFTSSSRGPQQAPVLRFLGWWEQVRRRYVFDVIGYVVMPEHFHLLISEPKRGDPSIVMKVLKQTVSRKLLSSNGTHFCQPRFYDFNVFSEKKQNEKINYMHNNPVKRGLVSSPAEWGWSSYRAYALRERGSVNMDWLFQPLRVSQKLLPT